MRNPLVRLAAVAAGVFVVLSCDGGPVTPRFGNGISGGPTGTAPVVPPNPGTPDTGNVFTDILLPANGQQVNIGDSILVRTRVTDDRNVAGLTIQAIKYTGIDSLGTLQQSIRYTAIPAPAPGAIPFRAGITDTTISRYLKPNVPVDSTLDSLVIFAVGRDAAGNVDTFRLTLQLVTGPAVNIIMPLPGDQVAASIPMTVTVHVTHASGVRSIRTRVQGQPTWTTPLDQIFDDIMVGSGQRDVTVTHQVLVPADATPGDIITITASAIDIQGNPGSTAPISITVRAFGTQAPRVTQVVPERLETGDCILVRATGDGIVNLGYTIVDHVTGLLYATLTVPVPTPPPVPSNAEACLPLNLADSVQGKKVRISSFADDAAGVRGFSVPSILSVPQPLASAAHEDQSLIVFGRSYKLPRSGVVGDVAIDTVRSRVVISNKDANRLDVWENLTQLFDPNGVAVGSQPWGLAVAINQDTLLVANSGGTNISRVYLGDNPGPVSTMREDLAQRIRTRTNFLYTATEAFDNFGAVHYATLVTRMFSDRPQYIGQTSDTTIYFSTRPTPVSPEGTVRYLDPRQPFPDLRTFVFVRDLATLVDNIVFVDIDSLIVRKASGTGIPDTVYLFDHLPGTDLPSAFVKTPTCSNGPLPTPVGITACGPRTLLDPTGELTDGSFDPRFPGGLPQGALSAALALRVNQRDNFGNPSHACAVIDLIENPTGRCSDIRIIEDATPVGITDTTFVATSAARNFIAFGEGNTSPGILLMAKSNPCTVSAVPACPDSLHPNRPRFPRVHSPIVTQIDLTNQASERIFGVAIDSTGRTIAAHGTQSYYSSVDNPFHLRLQGIYGDAGTGGAGIAYHPRADGVTHDNGAPSPADERLSFVAAGDKTIHAVDIAFFIRRGRYDLKHQLYGPLRVSRPMAGDNLPGTPVADLIILKLYGISLAGGLTVIDLRAADILAVP